MNTTDTPVSFEDSLMEDGNFLYPPGNWPYEPLADHFFGLSFRLYADDDRLVMAVITLETGVLVEYEFVDRREEAERAVLTWILEGWHTFTCIEDDESGELTTFPPPRIPSGRAYKSSWKCARASGPPPSPQPTRKKRRNPA